uniref:Integrase catalytic domain-containing protein n=1 Tax=Amphimedon queenslandica TaxID=400682 RepID=A0A1X7U0I1_AMPQE
VRSHFWIPQRRAMVCSFIHHCVIYRRYAVSSYKAPPAPLPDFRSSLRCLKRFILRRVLPSKIVSDNETTFKGASKSIRAIMEHPEVQPFVPRVNIKWSFNIERAPWWGGFFDRMVQLMKRCFRKLVGQAKLTYEELITGITEVKLILNSRPLTYMSSTDLDKPITPSRIILGRRLLDLPHFLCTNQDDKDYNSTYSMS